MQRLFLILVFLILQVIAFPQNYKPVDEGSKVHFVIKNFGINTGGDLSGLNGNISFTPDNLKASSINVSVDVKTINTDNKSRDEHLKSSDYFDAAKYPSIIIKSTQIDNTGRANSGRYYFTGTLTLHSITKIISFPFTAFQKGDDYLFEGKFDINRLDYEVGESSAVMSKTVKVSLSVFAKKS